MLRRSTSVPGTPNLLRRVNRNTIFRLLEHVEVASRAELSELSGLSPPTVSSVVRELLDEGWAREVGAGQSTGGKRPNLIRLNHDARFVLAVQFNNCLETRGTVIRMKLMNLAGEEKSGQQLTAESRDPEVLLHTAALQARLLVEAKGLRFSDVLGLGVAVPGVVDDRGIVSHAPELGWGNEPVQEKLRGMLGIPVVVENDVKLAALADWWARRCPWSNMVYLHIDQGIGAGIIVDRKLYKGAHWAAGEIGHLIVDPDTLKLTNASSATENFGPFEAYFGTRGLSVEDAALNDTDRFDWIIRHIAYGVVNTIAVLDPEAIVLGGAMLQRVLNFPQRLERIVSELTPYHPLMVPAVLGEDASLYGAVRAVLDHFESQVSLTSM